MIASYLARLVWTSGQALAAGRVGVLEPVRLGLRIWPTDVDTYGHVNNGRYLTLCDLGRWAHWVRAGWAGELVRPGGWRPVLAAAGVQFRRELLPLQRVELVTRLAAWDAKWWFYRHELVRGDEVCARALVRGVTRQRGRVVPPAEMLARSGVQAQSPEDPAALPDYVAVPDGAARG